VIEITGKTLPSPVVLCDKDHTVGSVVYALGNSKGMTSTFSDGMITYSNREVDGVRHIQHDAPISGGNSGGPLINIYGEVIGINTWTLLDSQNLNFAIHVSELEKLDYSTPMTVEEFYNTEYTPFEDLKTYIVENTYNEDGKYVLYLGNEMLSGYNVERYVAYVEEGNYISFLLIIGNEEAIEVIVDSELSGSYIWDYEDAYGNMMEGMIYANMFDGSKPLMCYYNNLTDVDLDAARQYATSLVHILCQYMSYDLSSIGLSAADFQFYNY